MFNDERSEISKAALVVTEDEAFDFVSPLDLPDVAYVYGDLWKFDPDSSLTVRIGDSMIPRIKKTSFKDLEEVSYVPANSPVHIILWARRLLTARTAKDWDRIHSHFADKGSKNKRMAQYATRMKVRAARTMDELEDIVKDDNVSQADKEVALEIMMEKIDWLNGLAFVYRNTKKFKKEARHAIENDVDEEFDTWRYALTSGMVLDDAWFKRLCLKRMAEKAKTLKEKQTVAYDACDEFFKEDGVLQQHLDTLEKEATTPQHWRAVCFWCPPDSPLEDLGLTKIAGFDLDLEFWHKFQEEAQKHHHDSYQNYRKHAELAKRKQIECLEAMEEPTMKQIWGIYTLNTDDPRAIEVAMKCFEEFEGNAEAWQKIQTWAGNYGDKKLQRLAVDKIKAFRGEPAEVS